MPDSSSSDTAITQNLQDALKALRPVMRQAMELSASDVSAIIAEPILQALGWDTRNPKQARRPEGPNHLRLLSRGKTALTVLTHASLDSVPDSVSGASEDSGEWIIATNGSTWNIFNQHNRSQPFRTVSIADAAAARDAMPVLEMLQRDAFLKDSLTEAWMSEAVDQDIIKILARHLDGSQALVSTVQEALKAQDITISADDARAALSRIDISLGGKPAADMVEAEPEVEAVAVKPASTAGGKTSKKTTAAKKPAAKSAKAKPASKTKSTSKKAPDAEQVSDTKTSDSDDIVAKSVKEASKPVDLPGSPDELGWPKSAAYAMHRKKNIVFMKVNENTGECTIMAGSLMVADLGKALGAPLVKARKEALSSGKLVPFGSGMLKVKRAITLQSPKAAASFAAATLVKDMSAWKDKDGNELQEALTMPQGDTSASSTNDEATEATEATSEVANTEVETA